LANSDKGITTVQHQPISSDSKKLDDILKKIDRMGKRLDTLEMSEKAPEKETSNTLKSLICPALEISTSINYLHFSFCRLFLVGLGSSYFYLHDFYDFVNPHPDHNV
jgi:hypothetical protein